MSSVRILRVYANGSQLEVEVDIDEDYPDAVAECQARALDTWANIPDPEGG